MMCLQLHIFFRVVVAFASSIPPFTWGFVALSSPVCSADTLPAVRRVSVPQVNKAPSSIKTNIKASIQTHPYNK